MGPGHLCPFPHELTFRMISLTSEPGDLVLDPFAGVGSVPAMADAMGRVGYGLEIARRYVGRFQDTVRQTQVWFAEKKFEIGNARLRHRTFYDTIVELRLLKFGNLLGKYLYTNGYDIEWIHVSKTEATAEAKYKIVVGEFEVKVSDAGLQNGTLEFLNGVSEKRPLSKFGVQPMFRVSDTERSSPPKYWYEGGKFWSRPKVVMPTSPGPHLSSDFSPRVDEVTALTPSTDWVEEQ